MEKTKAAAAVAGTFDLDSFDVVERANEGIVVEMKTEDGQPTNLFMRVLGRDSDAFKDIQFSQQTRRLNQVSANGGKIVFDAKESDEDGLDLLSACVTSWSVGQEPWLGHVFRKGETVPCTKDEVKKLFRRYPSFREQVDLAVGNRQLFLKESSDNSSSTPETN